MPPAAALVATRLDRLPLKELAAHEAVAAALKPRFTLAHLSAPHLGPLPRPRTSVLVEKRDLLDDGAFRAVLTRVDTELVLHGHMHPMNLKRLPTPEGHVPVIGVRSVSAPLERHGKRRGQYHPYRLERDGPGWRVEVEVRGAIPTLDGSVGLRRFSLSVPRGVALRAAVAPSRKVCASIGWP